MHYFDFAGDPISMDRYIELFADNRVMSTVLVYSEITMTLSTVWLGFSHGWSDTRAPLIFESMLFGVDDEIQHRFTTYAEAKAFHDLAVAQMVLHGATVQNERIGIHTPETMR